MEESIVTHALQMYDNWGKMSSQIKEDRIKTLAAVVGSEGNLMILLSKMVTVGFLRSVKNPADSPHDFFMRERGKEYLKSIAFARLIEMELQILTSRS